MGNQNSVQGMRWGVQVLPTILVVRMFGKLDHSLEEMFQKVSNRAHALNNRKVILDFSQTYSETPLSVVLCGYGLHHFRQLGIPVACISPPESVLAVLLENGVTEISDLFLGDIDTGVLN